MPYTQIFRVFFREKQQVQVDNSIIYINPVVIIKSKHSCNKQTIGSIGHYDWMCMQMKN